MFKFILTAALLKINSDLWKNVCVKITAGKMLDERVGYAKITIKNKAESKLLKKKDF